MKPGYRRKPVVDFFLVVAAILFILQPGSLVLAGFDAPYGLAAGITTWLSAFIGMSAIPLLYLLVNQKDLGKQAFPAVAGYIVFIVAIAVLTYYLQAPLYEGFRAPGYQQSFPVFCIGSVLTAVLSLALFPVGIIPANYIENPDNLLLGGVNLVLLAAIVSLFRIRSA